MKRVIAHIGGRWMSVFAMLLVVTSCSPGEEAEIDRVSRFGEYSGYSEESYDGWNRYSVYVPARDGTRLAVDYYLPTAGAEETAEPLPVILHYTRYIRAYEGEEGVGGIVDRDPRLQHMLKHGYVVAVADAPGTRASFGTRNMAFSAEEVAASHDIIEWLAAQPWCDGNVGMHGDSYPGMTQYQAAVQAPPHLKAIFAAVAGPSVYDFIYRGGTYKEGFIKRWGSFTQALDLGEHGTAARVDGDVDGSLRDAAVAEHAGNSWVHELVAQAGSRDWIQDFPNGGFSSWEQLAAIDDADAIEASGVAVYHLVSWFDIYTSQQPMLYANLEASPQKMLIGPWTHSGGWESPVYTAEFHRWYDHWLKGIDNGVMNEPPVHYWLMNGNNTVPVTADSTKSPDQMASDNGTLWQAADNWPPAGISMASYYFSEGPSGSVTSANDGILVEERPVDGVGRDEYTVDYTTTTGAFNRWKNGAGAQRDDPEGTTFFDERTPENEKALTYTTAPLSEDMVLVGYPVVHLWVTSTQPDGDFFAYLEEVDAQGRSHYVTEGALRASHRALSEPPWDNFGLPFHRSHEADLAPLPDEPTELVFDLMGTAIVVDAGHRVRVTITGADADNHALYPDPAGGAPTISIYRSSAHASFIELPHVTSE